MDVAGDVLGQRVDRLAHVHLAGASDGARRARHERHLRPACVVARRGLAPHDRYAQRLGALEHARRQDATRLAVDARIVDEEIARGVVTQTSRKTGHDPYIPGKVASIATHDPPDVTNVAPAL